MYQPDSEEEGVYDFYGLCDELGILVWSEFIFSDAIYPTNDWYLESIEPEIRQNVRRVNKHPSLAQWAGSNEVELYALEYTSGYVVCLKFSVVFSFEGDWSDSDPGAGERIQLLHTYTPQLIHFFLVRDVVPGLLATNRSIRDTFGISLMLSYTAYHLTKSFPPPLARYPTPTARRPQAY
jgi:hypothetical protein